MRVLRLRNSGQLLGWILSIGLAVVGCIDASESFSPTDPVANEASIDGRAQLFRWYGGGGLAQTFGFSCNQFDAYAPPLVYGPYEVIAEHIGSIHYSGSASPVGDTNLHGEVRYYGEGWVEEGFIGEFAFTTGNAVATVKTHFKGNPFGTAVNGQICAGGSGGGS